MKQLCGKLGIQKVQTGGYNPTGNSTIERFHRYLLASLCIIFDKEVSNWDEYLPPVLLSYRASVNDTTGFSPFFMETGRHPNLPMQILFPFLQKSPTDEAEYVTKICQELGQTFRIAADNQHAAAQKNLERICTSSINQILNQVIGYCFGKDLQQRQDSRQTFDV
jgi:hypothetical protein